MVQPNRRFIYLLFFVLLAEWFWVSMGRPTPTSSLSTSPKDVFDVSPLNSHEIKAVCAGTEWQDDAIFTCDNSVGGIGNIRNSILICTRFAIAAGAAMVMPKIIVRSQQDIAKIRTGEKTTMDYMFDTQHYVTSLRNSCPQLKLYETVEDIPGHEHIHGPIALTPEDLQIHTREGIEHPERWGDDFKAWLERETAGISFTTASRTTIVELKRSYLVYPVYSDSTAFAQTFGGILKFRPDVRELATTTFYALLHKYNLAWDGKSEMVENAYFGAHLRTEEDARKGWPGKDWIWSNYDTQSQSYLNQTIDDGLPLIYVASGDLSQTSQLAQDAAPYNITVTTKHDLLPPAELEQLSRMAWDQQGLVDYLVMTKASDFGGVAHSSFAWSVALKRHLSARRKDGKLHLQGPQMLSDEWSQIYGKTGGYPEYATCLWP